MHKIVNLVGARPQFVKAATISRVLRKEYKHEVDEIIVHSGQHYDQQLSQVFFDELDIPQPHFNLNVGSGSHAHQTAEILTKLEALLIELQPDLVIVYGDTNTTLAGAIAASKLGIRVAHIEGGLRSGNKAMPEEINRLATDAISDFIFCPNKKSLQNINPADNAIAEASGDVMYDSCLHYLKNEDAELLKKHGVEADNYLLCTVHRDFNTDDKNRLQNIISILDQLSRKIKIIFPVHPRTQKNLEAFNLKMPSAVIAIPPISYQEMLTFEHNAQIVVTDSGGVQKEAFFLKKPCIILRKETEWTEIVDMGNAILCDDTAEKALEAFLHFEDEPELTFPPIYGDGNAASKICNTLMAHL